MSDLDPIGTFRRFVWDELSTDVLRGFFGRRLQGTFSLGLDAFMEAVTQAIRAPWTADNPPPDAVALVAKEVLIPRYATDTNETYKDRVQNAWVDWERGGTDQAVITQLELAGFPGAQIFRWTINGSWSEFVVFYPDGTHTVTSDGSEIGSFTVGDGTIIGPEGITVVGLTTIKDIIKQWKPGQWKCLQVLWELSGWTVGTGHTIGESGLVIGGAHAASKVQ
jgi:hypothetical protein